MRTDLRKLKRRPLGDLLRKNFYASSPSAAEDISIPVSRPLLPRAERLYPYLCRIDQNRFYSNHGALVHEFETRLTSILAPTGGRAMTASSGTAAIAGAILASAGRATESKGLALVPAFTFVATAIAVEACGYRPVLADIDPTDWLLKPESLVGHPLLDQIGVVIPVAPFGRPVPQAPWREFQRQTGIPVVIDGAASFDRITTAPDQYIGEIPVAISFHATKAFGVGEGGGIVTTNETLANAIWQSLNFGFFHDRNSKVPSLNGKMSEYHAAVGLAELDGWNKKRIALQAVINSYRRHFARVDLAGRFVGAPDISLSYALFVCVDRREADLIQRECERRNIGTRLWYGSGLQGQNHFATAPVLTNLTSTDRVAPCVVGLPMAPDLTEAQIKTVVTSLFDTLQSVEGARESGGIRSTYAVA